MPTETPPPYPQLYPKFQFVVFPSKVVLFGPRVISRTLSAHHSRCWQGMCAVEKGSGYLDLRGIKLCRILRLPGRDGSASWKRFNEVLYGCWGKISKWPCLVSQDVADHLQGRPILLARPKMISSHFSWFCS